LGRFVSDGESELIEASKRVAVCPFLNLRQKSGDRTQRINSFPIEGERVYRNQHMGIKDREARRTPSALNWIGENPSLARANALMITVAFNSRAMLKMENDHRGAQAHPDVTTIHAIPNLSESS
jgi:hypothetical protein